MDITVESSLGRMSTYERNAWTSLIANASEKKAVRKFVPQRVGELAHAASGRTRTIWAATPGSTFLDAAFATALEGVHAATTNQGLHSVNTAKVVKSFQSDGHDVTVLGDLRLLDLQVCDLSLPRHRQGYTVGAVIQGASASVVVTGATVATTVTAGTTAAVAIGAVAADVTATMIEMGRIVALVAARYGYDVRSPEEEVFAAGALTYAVAHGAKQQLASLTSLSRLTQLMMRNPTWKQLQSHQIVKVVEVVFKALGVRLTQKKLAQFVPVLGVVINGGMNYQLANQTFRRSMQAYRLRFLTEKYGLDPTMWTQNFDSADAQSNGDELPRVDDIAEAELVDLDVSGVSHAPIDAGGRSVWNP